MIEEMNIVRETEAFLRMIYINVRTQMREE